MSRLTCPAAYPIGWSGAPPAFPMTLVWEGSFLADSYRTFTFEVASPGAVKLEMDGSVVLDDGGIPLPSFDDDDVMDGARAWTGFEQQSNRGKLQKIWLFLKKYSHTQKIEKKIAIFCFWKVIFL